MKKINSKYIKEIIEKATLIASLSKCKRSKRGVVISTRNIELSSASNGPIEKVCNSCLREGLESGISLELCSNHAEQKAINDLRRMLYLHNEIKESVLYHVKLVNGNVSIDPGIPYCIFCSQEILNIGIPNIVLCGKETSYMYEKEEFHELSIYNSKKIKNE